MKFAAIKRFFGKSPEDVRSYVEGDLSEGIRKLLAGLGNLNLIDNFDGFLWEGDITAGNTVTITNPLGQIPSQRIILGSRPLAAGTVIIDDSLTAWSSDAVYLKNGGTAGAHVKAFFIR